MRLLIIGNRGGTNVGECFERAAVSSGVSVRLIEANQAMEAPQWLRRLNWHLRGHRPTRLHPFSDAVRQVCDDLQPHIVLTTGLSPVTGETLARIGSAGVLRVNYLTDDPWSKAHRARWFMKALMQYDFVFSPRRANIGDLKAAGCRVVEYVPFGYDPAIHFVERDAATYSSYESDILFVGGADRERIPYCRAIREAGFRLSLYGDYWDRYRETRDAFRGYADVRVLRLATSAAKVCLCLVRRGNRDGHVMRTFEMAAMEGCMLIEDTPEHREIFGADGEAVLYFRSIQNMVDRARWLLQHETERKRLAATAHARITRGHHTYADRLQAMLETADLKPQPLLLG